MWAGRSSEIHRETAVRVVSLGKSTEMLAMVSEVWGVVFQGAAYHCCRSLVLCQDLAGSQDTQCEYSVL
jgi:hypothetical protein